MQPNERTGRADGPYRFWSLGTASLLLLMLAAQVPDACTGPSVNEQIADTNPAPDVEPNNRVLEDPSEFYGTERVASGEVGEVLSPAAFVMVEEADNASGRRPEGVLVINSDQEAPAPELAAGQPVTVTGLVEEFFLEEAEKETGVDLNDEVLAEREGKPAVYATSVNADDAAVQGETTREG